jgi:phosphoserine/homoserine phosphotransferase
MHAVCSDLEGIWVPEVWINVAKTTGIDELKLTTRDIKDYDELMTHRLKVSDTFVEFADPLMDQLGRPLLFCNSLTVDSNNNITGYRLRQKDQKKKVVQALKSLNYEVIAIGDSYNDISMLKEADKAILARPPKNVIDDYPEFPVIHEYENLKDLLLKYFNN